MPRQTRKVAAKMTPIPDQDETPSSEKRAMILPRCLLNADGNASVVKLKNPKTGNAEMYLFDSHNENVFQLMKFRDEPSSWFVDDSVIQDGSLTFATNVDPIFLILPYLTEAIKFQPLDHLLVDEVYPECKRLLSCKGLQHIAHVSDTKESGQIKAYCFNSTKCMLWLSAKVNALADKLKNADVHVASGSKVATFISSKKETANTKDYIKFAHGMISEYLSAELSKSLLSHLGLLSDESENIIEEAESPPTKRSKLEVDEGPLEDYSKSCVLNKKSNQPKKLTAAQRSLSKVNTSSMKTISSFFGRKKSS